MAARYTIAQFSDRLKRLRKDLNKAILPPFREHLKIMQSGLIGRYWSNKFGARIWEWRQERFGAKGGPSVKLGSGRRRSYARYSATQKAFVATIRIGGIAAKMEEGGNLRRHVIFGRAVRQPGLPVPSHRVLRSEVENKLWPQAVDAISRSFRAFVERTF